MTINEKRQLLSDSTCRMRNDAERIRNRIDRFNEAKLRTTIEDAEERLFEIDEINSDTCAVVAFLSTLQMMLYSDELSMDIFELTPIRKQDFTAQVTNLLSFYKSISFAIQELSKNARAVFEYKTNMQRIHYELSGEIDVL